jgi:hypothetical protein
LKLVAIMNAELCIFMLHRDCFLSSWTQPDHTFQHPLQTMSHGWDVRVICLPDPLASPCRIV